jgi:hypothetical protein
VVVPNRLVHGSPWVRLGIQPAVLVVAGITPWRGKLIEGLAARGCWVSSVASLSDVGATEADVGVVVFAADAPIEPPPTSGMWLAVTEDPEAAVGAGWESVAVQSEGIGEVVGLVLGLSLGRLRHEWGGAGPRMPRMAPVGERRLQFSDGPKCYVAFGERRIRMSRREWSLLRRLHLASGRVVPRVSLLLEVWGPEYSGTERVLDVRLADLRRKLRGWPGRIEAVRGVGYRLVEGDAPLVGD